MGHLRDTMMERPIPGNDPKATPVEQARELLKAGDVQEAHRLFLSASLRKAGDPEIVAGLALCLDRLGRHVEAARQWAHLERHMPDAHAGENALNHAACLIELGEFEGAKTLLRAVRNDHIDNGRKLGLLRRIAAAGGGDGAISQPAKGGGYAARAGGIMSSNPALRAGYAELIADRPVARRALAFRSVVMVTYGRTGSTLLQGVLNTIDGMRFLGENEGAFFHLFSYVRTIERLSRRTDTDLPNSPFFSAGALDPATAKQAARAAVDAYFAPAREEHAPDCIGFKDVRYIDHPDQLAEYLGFLEEMFDSPAFVFLWRDHAEVLRSGWWKQTDRVKAAATLEAVERQAGEFARARSNCYTLTYADLVARTERLRNLFGFLGAEFAPDRVDAVMSIPHSYDPERPEIRQMFENAWRDRRA